MILLLALPSLPLLLVYLLIICIVLGAAYWLITNLMPAPFQRWAIGVLIVVVVIVLVYLLLGLVGGGGGMQL